MATRGLSDVVEHLRRVVLVRDGAGLTDGQLLEAFVAGRDDASFAAYVKEHVFDVSGHEEYIERFVPSELKQPKAAA